MSDQIKQCLRVCECHSGTRFDQCECICPSWCGNSEFDSVLKKEPEGYIFVNASEWYCINCGKYYPKFQKRCNRCLEENTIEEGDW